jgi:hypothetical protein
VQPDHLAPEPCRLGENRGVRGQRADSDDVGRAIPLREFVSD